MQYIKRDLTKKVQELSQEYACILITGPRQVGKSTLFQHVKDENREEVTLDDLEERALAKRDPAMFLQIHGAPILIDEVQYAPELFSYIKIAIDNLLAYRFAELSFNGTVPGIPGRESGDSQTVRAVTE